MMTSGFRVLPEDLKKEIDSLGRTQFVFGAARKFSEQLLADWTARLDLEAVSGSEWVGLPPASAGRWSKWNLHGRELVRKDLPKVGRSWSVEAPNFGGHGTHPVTFFRQVYPKQRLYGQQLEASVVRVDEPRDLLVGTVLFSLQAPYEEEEALAYLYAASLSRTWFGSATPYRMDELGVPQIPEQGVSWEFLPDGHIENLRDAVTKAAGQSVSPQEIEIMIDRLEKVQSLAPQRRLVGSSGLQRYIGYMFGEDFVAFENPRVGNALYLMYGDWRSLSRLSRSELLASREGEFNRIIHSAEWFLKLRLAVYDYRNS